MRRAKLSQSLQESSTTKKVVAGVAIVGGVALALVLARKRVSKGRGTSRYPY